MRSVPSSGLGLGAVLAVGYIEQILTTVGDLYFRAEAAPDLAVWPPYLKAALLGVAVSVLAAIQPATEAAGVVPLQALSRAGFERQVRRRAGVGAIAAPFVAAAGIAMLAIPGEGLLIAFVALFGVLAAYALATPWLVDRLLSIVYRALGRNSRLATRLAVRGASASLSRTGIATAALSVAVATVVGIGVMIDSFRTSVGTWLDRAFVADYYVVTDPGAALGDAGGFSPVDVARLTTLPGVAGVSRTRRVEFPLGGMRVNARAISPGPRGYGEQLRSAVSNPEARLASGEGVYLTEPFAERQRLEAGDSLAIDGAGGTRRFLVAAIVRDYRTDGSDIVIDYQVAEALWGPRAPTGVGLYLENGSDIAAFESALDALVSGRPATRWIANGALRDATLTVFDRTFAVTAVLRLLAGTIAFFGIVSALLALQLERRREVATLRAIGFSRSDVWRNAVAQTTLTGFAAGLAAIPLGLVLALLLIRVINERSLDGPWSCTSRSGNGSPASASQRWRPSSRDCGRQGGSQTNRRRAVWRPSDGAVASGCGAARRAAVERLFRRSFGPDTDDDDASLARFLSGNTGETTFERALGPRDFSFPADHGPHPAFRTECGITPPISKRRMDAISGRS